ncbi:hypothetical protein EDB86DRAFT_2947114 [Lactarius hatsudake]|nr:hypothetical protein EDB86DRAFT_2947114 [Lactarius hatsudake]
MMPAGWRNGEIDGTTWHELLRSFIGVNKFRICATLSKELSRALQVNEVGLDPGFLPCLQEIVIELFFEMMVGNLFGSFIHTRRVAGRPVRPTLSNTVEGGGSNTTEVSEDVSAWLLNSANKHCGTAIPQRRWAPQNEAQRRVYVPLNIIFVLNDSLGLPIATAATRECTTLLDAGNLAPVEDFSTIFIRINWPGYPVWDAQILTRDIVDHNTITVAKFAKRVASHVCRFIDEQSRSHGGEARWRIGPGGITRDHVILIGVVRVSHGSWQPILQLNRHII